MRETKPLDYFLLTLLALIWASAFFNIKIATYSYGPLTIAFLRIFFGAIPVVLLCYIKKIKIEAFSKDWYWFATIGIVNLVVPFFLIAYGVQKVQSNLAAILMASTPLSASILAHFFTKNEKINLIKTFGVLIGFSGIVFLFSDDILINKNNFVSAILMPISLFLEQPWNLNPRLDSTLSLIYLGIFSTGIAWLLRFYILKHNGLVFQAQVAYLIPIFGVILGFVILNEVITSKVIISLIAVIIGIYIVKKGSKIKLV